MSLALILLGALAAGTAFVRWLRPAGWVERETFRTLFGLGCVGWVMLPLATVSLAWGWTGLGLLCAGSLTAIGLLPRAPRPPRVHAERLPKSLLDKALAAIPLLALVIALPAMLAPETAWDAAASHLALAQDYVRSGHIRVSNHNLQTAYPHLLHTLNTYAFSGAGELGVHFVGFLLAAAGCGAAFSLGRRLGRRRGGLLAASFFSTMPLFFDQAGKALLDIPFMAVLLAVLSCFAAWGQGGKRRWLAAAGLLLGIACGIRHTGFLAGALLVVFGPFWRRNRQLETILVFSSVLFAAILPQILRNLAQTGTPLYPFLQGYFPAHNLPAIVEGTVGGHSTQQGTRGIEVLTFLWTIVARPNAYDGWNASPGPWALVLGLPAILLGKRRMRLTGLFGAAGTLAFFYFQHYARYAAPFLAPLACAGAALPTHRPRLGRGTAPLACGVCLAFLGLGAMMNAPRVPAALGLTSRPAYLAARIERYDALRWAGSTLGEKGRILSLDPRYYYLQAPAFVNLDYLGALRGKGVEDQARALREAGIRYVLYPAHYVERSPGLVSSGLAWQCARWRLRPDLFRPLRVFLTPQADSSANVEVTTVFEIVRPGDSTAGEDLAQAGPAP